MTHQLTGRLLILMLLLIAGPAAASLTASVDRTLISDQDLLELTVRASNDTADLEPDFSGMDRDFDVVSNSSSRSSSMQIVNGKTTSTVHKDYSFTLVPKRQGQLTIPSLRAGSAVTQPITIEVRQLSAADRARMNRFVFFETEVDTNETYVQGQIIYSVRLFYTEAIGGDFPQPPVLENAIVETIENEKRYESVVNGRRFYVLEKRYAIFPQRSGPLVIPRERFAGTRGRGSFFTQAQRVSAISEGHTVNVKTIPSQFTGDSWLPAKALVAREIWESATPTFRVGEPVNRKILISAIGASDSLLPQPADVPIPNAKTYADPATTQNRVGPDGVTALQETTIGIVPTAPGPLTLPEIRINWWNTQTDREEVAIIPAATYNVLPAVGDAATAPVVTVPLTELQQQSLPAAATTTNPYWQWAAIALGVLWVLSTWQWLVTRRRVRALESENARRFVQATFDDPDEQREFKALSDACRKNRAGNTHRQLFLWARARYPQVDSLQSLSRQHPELAEEIQQLEAALYSSSGDHQWRGSALLERVTQLRKQGPVKPDNGVLQASLNPV